MVTSSTNPKSLVMLDAAGKVATLKLTTSTGLHVYDGSMLWVNPAQTVTAAAPRSAQAVPQQNVALHKPTKALPIVDPKTGDELVVKKPEVSPPVVTTPPPPPPPATATISLPVPGVPTPAAPSVPPMLVHPTSTPIFTPTVTPSPPPPKEQNIIDLLAKAIKTTPTEVLAMSPISNAMPPVQGRGRAGRDRDREFEGRDRNKGRPGGKGAAQNTQSEGKGKGRGSRVTVPNDDQRSRRKVELGRYPGERYTKDAKYTASLDGRFWSLSCWPTGERDDDHRLTFGKHKLEVLENGIVKVVLFGGVNRYKIRLHLCTEGDDLGNLDKDGWGVASCEPNAANLQLSEEAEQLGWKIFKGGEHPQLYPPEVAFPEQKQDDAVAADPEKTEVNDAAPVPEKGADEKQDVTETEKAEPKGEEGNAEEAKQQN